MKPKLPIKDLRDRITELLEVYGFEHIINENDLDHLEVLVLLYLFGNITLPEREPL